MNSSFSKIQTPKSVGGYLAPEIEVMEMNAWSVMCASDQQSAINDGYDSTDYEW